MTEYIKKVMGLREYEKKVTKGETSTLGSGCATDNTDSKQTSENNAAQKYAPNMPVEQDEQTPKEGQASNDQTEPKTRDPRHNIGKPVDQFRGEVFDERRSSVPDVRKPVGNKQLQNIMRHQSEPVLNQLKTVGELKLDDPLSKSVSNNLTLREGLARCLDKEHIYGRQKCWKHLAEQFGVEESIYKTFTCCSKISPTENLLYFVKTQKPSEEFTIEKLKEGLDFIGRNDVIEDVFLKHKDWDSELTDKTTVGSLFDSHPLIIGDIAVLLDVDEPGKKNWRQLADWFCVPKSESQKFAESIQNNPTEQLLEYIKCRNPQMTVGDLQIILERLHMQGTSNVLTNSEKVTKYTLLRDLWDQDYKAGDNLCNHLNQLGGWRHLGFELKIKKDDLDTFPLTEGEVISPTEALLSHLGAAQIGLTMKDLIWALASIERNDALSVIKDHFPEGVVDSFLERKRASTVETAV